MTESGAGIAGGGSAADEVLRCLLTIRERVTVLPDALEEALEGGSAQLEGPSFEADSDFLWLIRLQVASWLWKRCCLPSVDVTVEASHELAGTTKSLLSAIADLRVSKEAAFTKAPRLTRIAALLQLSQKEARALEYGVVSQLMPLLSFAPASMDFNSAELLVAYAGFSPAEFLTMFAKGRMHVQQGIVELEQGYNSSLCKGEVRSSLEALRTLTGCTLTQEELLKVDNTALSALLEQEGEITTNTASEPHGHSSSAAEQSTSAASTERAGNGGAAADVGIDSLLERIQRQQEEVAKVVEEQLSAAVSGDEADGATDAPAEAEQRTQGGSDLLPYTDDIDYLSDHFQLVAALIKSRHAELEQKDSRGGGAGRLDDDRKEGGLRQQIREAKGKKKILEARCARRMALTTAPPGGWLPRLELLASNLALDSFEKFTVLIVVGGIISTDIKIAGKSSYEISGKMSEQTFDVGTVLFLLCEDLKDQLGARKYFYKSSKLIKEGILRVAEPAPWGRGSGDLTSNSLEIDRRMLDFVVGLDTELNEIVEGSNLYAPQVPLEKVVLPKAKKQLVVDTVSSFDVFKKYKQDLLADDLGNRRTAGGLILLFYGASGTGKTLMANALASHLGKKLLLINFGNLGDKTGDTLRFIFRESKINSAVLFFDECEAMFESRDRHGRSDIASILTEIEKHDGLIILATNRAYDMDEAMYRRINLSVEFEVPGPTLRREIWAAHLPTSLATSDDVDVEELATSYELTGGFIKNAILGAISRAITRDGREFVVRMEDLVAGARLQMEGCMAFMSEKFDRRVVPSTPLDSMVLPAATRAQLKTVVAEMRCSKVLQQDWGFDGREATGAICLLHGAAGTGKAMAADALGFELGKPLLVVSAATLLSRHSYRENSLGMLFKEAKKGGAVLCIKDFGRLFDALATSGPTAIDIGLLMHHVRQFAKGGVVVLCTRTLDGIDKAVLTGIRHIVAFPTPGLAERKQLWQACVPAAVPLADDVDFNKLAVQFHITGGQTSAAAYEACSSVARASRERVTQADFVRAATRAEKNGSDLRSASSMYN